MNQKKGSQLGLLLDLIFLASVIILALNHTKNLDPGDYIFLFVYENLIAILSFLIFLILFYPLNKFILNKHQIDFRNWFTKNLLFQNLKKVIGFLISLFIIFIVIIFFNQLCVELLVAFLKDNSYHFKSIQILGEGGMFFEKSVVSELENLFQKNYSLFFMLVGVKYFISQIIDFFTLKTTESNSYELFGTLPKIVSQIILAPILIFASCIFLVILSSLFGVQTWIIFVTLAIFRLLFWIITKKITEAYKKI